MRHLKTTQTQSAVNIATYTRVSTVDQSTERQEQNLQGKLYRDKISGSTKFAERPWGQQLIEDVQSGKINHIIFHSVDRAGRDIMDVQSTINTLIKLNCQVEIKNINLKMLDDNGKLNLISKMVLDLMGSIANIEINNMKERQLEGIAMAKQRNVYTGRQHGAKGNPEKLLTKHNDIVVLLNSGLSMKKASRFSKKSFATVKRIHTIINNPIATA